jgi:hypothetical protein
MARLLLLLLFLPGCAVAPADRSPRGLYVDLLEQGTRGLAAALDAEGIQRHTGAVLAGAVLYREKGDLRNRDLAFRAGDLLADESEAGRLTWLNHRWCLAPWIDAWRLLESELGGERRARWRREIGRQLEDVAKDVAGRESFPRYQSPFIRTSPNHLSIWASSLHLGGKVFGNREWEELGARVLHRFAAMEQSPDGTWGEHSDAGPTTGYNYLTTASVALYAEHSGDPDAIAALRRALDFHSHFTWPDGTPVEVVNDRNRHWAPSGVGHFGFSRFPDGRRYSEFLAGFLRTPKGEALSRIAQNALYWHEGPSEPAPRDRKSWVYRMKAPAAIRKDGPWWIATSALIATQAPRNPFYLDRQAHLSVFHEKAGLIVNGGNSKRQPELATFSEKIQGERYHLPISSALDGDRLSLAYNSFWADLRVKVRSASRVEIEVEITEQGRIEEAQFTLQLVGAVEPGKDVVRVRHGGWTLTSSVPATVAWPVYPYNPYANGPETGVDRAVATLTIPLAPVNGTGPFRTQRFALSLDVD